MKILNCEQMSEEWFAARCGKPSASRFAEIVTTKGEPSKQSTKYLYELAGERVVGAKAETYQSPAMLRGIELEPEARELYEFVTGEEVQQVGTCMDDDERWCASSDGMVGDDGVLEIKCPTLSVAVEYLSQGKLPTKYYQQVQGQMFVTNRGYCDFVSYYPGLKPLIVRVEKDSRFCDCLEESLIRFCETLEKIVEEIS